MRKRTTHTAAGFTLVEVLVVLGIIILLIGLLSPMISRTYRAAERARAQADLGTIASALESYKQDFAQYPLPTNNGANTLCVALIGPGPANGTSADGLDGPGFRVRRFAGADGLMNTADDDLNTKAYPPYIQPDRFKIGNATGATTTVVAEMTILDRFRKPILYYPALGNPNIRMAAGYVNNSGKPLFNSSHNTQLDPQRMRLMLGDNNNNGFIDGSETAAFVGAYILWSAGPDELYGPQMGDAPSPTVLDAADVVRCDDLTNFKT